MLAELVEVKTLDGRWEVLGVDRTPGVYPEGLSRSYNAWGSDGLTFTLRRDPTVAQPDLGAFTPARVVVGDLSVWSGLIIETPGSSGQDPSINVTGIGWQYHLDDDPYPALFVHQDLAAWQDARGFAAAPLGFFQSVPTVNNAGGGIVLAWPNGQIATTLTSVGVMVDFGPNPDLWPERVEATWEYIAPNGASPNTGFYIRAADSPAFVSSTTGGVEGTTLSTLYSGTNIAAGSYGGTTATPRRYVCVFLHRAGATVNPLTSDYGIRLTGLRAYRKAAYAVANASIVKVSDIVREALKHAPLLSQDTAGIVSTLLSLPHVHWPERRTARETLEGYNAYHRYRLALTADTPARLLFDAPPSRPALKVDLQQPGARFADASANSGRDVYNRVYVHGRSGSGEELEVIRNAIGLAGEPAAVKLLNPTLAVDFAGWTVEGAGVGARNAGAGYNGAAGYAALTRAPNLVPTDKLVAQASGLFVAGVTYRILVPVRVGSVLGAGGTSDVAVSFGAHAAGDFAVTVAFNIEDAGAVWNQGPTVTPSGGIIAEWTPAEARSSGVTVKIGSNTSGLDEVDVDELVLTGGGSTLVDRRSFTRSKVLEVGSPTDPVAMAALGDAWLALHQRAPLKGALEVTADDAVTELVTDAAVPVADLGGYVGQIIHLADLVDPDTGGQGRNGIVAGATINGGSASLTIDNDRGNFDALLARMAVVAK